MRELRKYLVFLLWLCPGGVEAQRQAKWIRPGFAEDTVIRPCPIFRKTFLLRQRPVKATLVITAHGLYDAVLDGTRVGTGWFTPGFTDYHRRLQYQTYDVTRQLHAGSNLLLATVGDGWWRGKFGADEKNNRYGREAGVLARLEIRYADGEKETVVTDSSWECTTGPIRYADLYTGEIQDTRIQPGPWRSVEIIDGAGKKGDHVVPGTVPPVREHETFHPVRIFTTPKGEQVLDFGQNLAGWVRFRVNGEAGDTVRLAHAEALDAAGNFYVGNLRLAKAEDMYVLSGGPQELAPHFTYHGFRYVRVEGYPDSLKPENFTAVALYTDLAPAGHFTCSDSMLNQLQHNICWSQKSNFFDIPTDCPQRSERFGWAGDAQMFARTAAFNMDVKAFYTKWLADLAAQQGTNGGLPVYIPDFRTPDSVGPRGGVAGWGDAATILPWTLYDVYGDTSILRHQYSSMKAWVDYIGSKSPDDLWTAKGYGDWYAPGDSTSLPFIDQCFYYHSVALLVQTASMLHHDGVAAGYAGLADHIRQAFLRAYGQFDTRATRTQTAYTLALAFDLLRPEARGAIADSLAARIVANNDHLGTGFLGTPYLLWVLAEYGHQDLAFILLTQKTLPSWLYPITKGATTIWEKWDAIRPDGSFDTCSLNHYAYGAVGDWLYRYVAGIDAAQPGYRKIRIQPHVGGGLTWVKASYRCPYGLIVSNWAVEGNWLKVEVIIPAHTTAVILLPEQGKSAGREVGPGRYHWRVRMPGSGR